MIFVIAALCGMLLWLTPIPLLPIMYFGCLFGKSVVGPNPKGATEVIIFILINVWMIAVPVFVAGIAFEMGGAEGIAGLLTGLVSTWLYALWLRAKEPGE